MHKKYIGLTIGPIVKTIQNARETGQLWGASYIFSYMMKDLIKKIKEKGIAKKFIVPYAGDEVLKLKLGVGLFPDRLIFETEDTDLKKMNELVDEVLEEISDKIVNELGAKHEDKVINYIKDYFQIYYIIKELQEEDNPILKLSPYLDMLELNESVIPKEVKNYLLEFLKNENIKKSFLTADDFSMEEVVTNGSKNLNTNNAEEINKDSMYIKSIPEIAVSGTNLTEEEIKKVTKEYEIEAKNKDKDIDFFEVFKKMHPEIRIKKHDKYIAIVQADGDNVGKIIKNINELYNDKQDREKSNFEIFSEKLFKYAKKAINIIKEYKGFPIYAGGDDLLFFAPVVSKRGNIFDLLDDISEEFNRTFEEEIKSVKLIDKPSLSFGVSISYYKYPLYEALEQAGELLFNRAKNFKNKEGEKNAIAFRVLKHSGQYFEGIVRKDSNSYKRFKKLLITDLNDSNFLSSLQYKIKDDQLLIKEVLEREDMDLKNYFENNFNEDVHQEAHNYMENIKNLIKETYEENNDKGDFKFIDIVYSYLRFVKFLSEKEGEDV